MVDTAVVPSAGYGTRLLPITKALSKAILPLGTIPILADVLWEAYYAGIKKAIIVTHWKEETIKGLIEAKADELRAWLLGKKRMDLIKKMDELIPNMEIEFITQDILNGLGGAILLTEKMIDGPFAVLLSDNIILEPDKGSLLRSMISLFNRTKADTILSVAKVSRDKVKKFGVIGYNNTFEYEGSRIYEVNDIIEKPDPDVAPSNMAVVGRYIFSTEIFDYLRTAPIVGKEIDETQAFKRQAEQGRKVFAMDIGARKWFDVGSIEGYFKAFVSYVMCNEGKEKVEKWLKEIL